VTRIGTSKAQNRASAKAKLRERNLREFTVTIVVDPQKQDDPDLRYQLAQAKHHGERIGLVVGGFNYDVGLQLVQLGNVTEVTP
jgi:hypothetical protein